MARNDKTRNERITFLCNKEERETIIKVAEALDRSQGDAIRYIVLRIGLAILNNDVTGITGISDIKAVNIPKDF